MQAALSTLSNYALTRICTMASLCHADNSSCVKYLDYYVHQNSFCLMQHVPLRYLIMTLSSASKHLSFSMHLIICDSCRYDHFQVITILKYPSGGSPGECDMYVVQPAFQVPRMCLLGRSPPCNVTVALDLSPLAGALSLWPKFHNGVAVGLRLQSLRSTSRLTARQRKSVCITRTWIVYNKPEIPTPQHGGLLLALGLQQQLHVLAMTDIYEYLTLGHDPTTVGMCCSGWLQQNVAPVTQQYQRCYVCTSRLSSHSRSQEMEVSAAAQTAAITGIGMLYCAQLTG